MKDAKNKTCSICNATIQGAFCHSCGQKITGDKLNIKSVAGDLLSNLFSLEKSILATLLYILKSPSKVIKNYWEGNRRYYESPSKLVVFASLIIGLHLVYHKNLIFGLGFTDSPQAFFLILFIVIFTLSSFLLYFKHNYTFLEILVANIYLFCTFITILILLFELLYFFDIDQEILGISMIITLSLLMSIYSSIVLSSKKKIGHTILNIFLQLFLSIILLTIIFILLISFGEVDVEL